MIQFREYLLVAPSRFELDRSRGSVLLEFGADWCGFCKIAQPAIAAALSRRPDVLHVKVGDGPGKPLGRSYHVKLWPTLIVLLDGAEVARLVTPTSPEISALLKAVEPPMQSHSRADGLLRKMIRPGASKCASREEEQVRASRTKL